MLPLNDNHREEIKALRSQIWSLYKELKRYQREPDKAKAEILSKQFDEIFKQKTSYETLNRCLERLAAQKELPELVTLRLSEAASATGL